MSQYLGKYPLDEVKQIPSELDEELGEDDRRKMNIMSLTWRWERKGFSHF